MLTEPQVFFFFFSVFLLLLLLWFQSVDMWHVSFVYGWQICSRKEKFSPMLQNGWFSIFHPKEGMESVWFSPHLAALALATLYLFTFGFSKSSFLQIKASAIS